MISTDDVDEFLRRYRNEPLLLPLVTDRDLAAAIEGRRVSCEHICLRCDATARVSVVIPTYAGPRWLDLCESCGNWLLTGIVAPRPDWADLLLDGVEGW
jgi:hypothetical protein